MSKKALGFALFSVPGISIAIKTTQRIFGIKKSRKKSKGNEKQTY